MSIQRYASKKKSNIYEACNGGMVKYEDHKQVCKDLGKSLQYWRDRAMTMLAEKDVS